MRPAARILIVEDEAVVAMDIRAQLEGLGYDVVGTAASAARGIELARVKAPDLILMDIQLAGERSGIEAADEIRHALNVPVVFLTAFADSVTLSKAKEVSPYGYIVKPFDEQDLKTAIEIALSRSAVERSLVRSRADLEAILDAQRQGAVVVDSGGSVAFVSRGAEALIRRSREDLLGRRWQETIPVERAILDRLVEQAGRQNAGPKKLRAQIEGVEPAVDLEIELVDDPRESSGFILFLYDVTDVSQLRNLLDEESVFERIIGSGKSMQAVFQLIQEISSVDSPVLIQGETGTGKELVARAIHQRSSRSGGPFIPVNCGALTTDLASSQLFGHRKGSFTGAISDHEGFFSAAHEGTLFLDEIGELPSTIQPTLLRALDDRGISPVGETVAREVDFRLVAATSRSLEDEIERQEFRSDLYYRLSVVRVVLPPLRERLEDLPILTRAFLAEARAKTGKQVFEVSTDTMSILLHYSWPGNVRQLKNALEFATIRASGPEVLPEHLPSEIGSEPVELSEDASEADRIRAALAQTRGNRQEAAKILGISRSTFYRWLERLDLED